MERFKLINEIQLMLTDEAKADKNLNAVDKNMLAILQYIKDGKANCSNWFNVLIKHPKGKWDDDEYTSVEKYFAEFGVKTDDITLYRSINKLQRLGYINYETGVYYTKYGNVPRITLLKGTIGLNSCKDIPIAKNNSEYQVNNTESTTNSPSNIDMNTWNKIIERLEMSLEPLLNNGDLIDLDMFSDLMRLKNSPLFNTIFPKGTPKEPLKYKLEIYCSTCGGINIIEVSKTKLIEYLKSQTYKCQECSDNEERLTQERLKRDWELAAERQRQMEKKELVEKEKRDLEQTKKCIDTYLNPDCSWNDGVRLYTQLNELAENLTYSALEYASRMNYSDFLKTPYWKTITGKVKQMHNYTCQLCGKTGVTLHTHHPSNYSFRGFEINHLNELMCLCSDCHSKFHNKN